MVLLAESSVYKAKGITTLLTPVTVNVYSAVRVPSFYTVNYKVLAEVASMAKFSAALVPMAKPPV